MNCGVIHRALQKGEPPYGNREQPPKMPLPPDGQRAHCLEMASAPIGVDDYGAVLENRASLLFFGVVEYEDVFGIVHETRFSWGWWGSGIPNDLTFGVDGPKDWTRYS